MEGWPGYIDLGDWLDTVIIYPVTHPGTNRARRKVTTLTETNERVTTKPNRQVPTICIQNNNFNLLLWHTLRTDDGNCQNKYTGSHIRRMESEEHQAAAN